MQSRTLFRLVPVLLLCLVSAFSPSQNEELKFAELGICKLASGQQIENCRLGYRTWGRLNAQRSNAILFPTWFSGNSRNIAGFVGSDKMLDPAKYFIVAIDALGNGVSSSPSNSATQHGPAFPAFTTRDMVNAEYRLATEILHLNHVHAVMGISMGGYGAILLAEKHPERALKTNVEYYAAPVLMGVGLTPDLFPATFALARHAGWTAHAIEQGATNRLIRPDVRYVGPAERHLPNA